MRKGRASIQMVLNKYEDLSAVAFLKLNKGDIREFQSEIHSFVQRLTVLASSFLSSFSVYLSFCLYKLHPYCRTLVSKINYLTCRDFVLCLMDAEN